MIAKMHRDTNFLYMYTFWYKLFIFVAWSNGGMILLFCEQCTQAFIAKWKKQTNKHMHFKRFLIFLFITPQTNFLHPFSSLKPINSGAHPRHRSITRGVTLCWLNLLVSVTFFTDGQQGVVKTPGAVEVLLELSGAQNRQLQEKALLVLRNLCFHGASRPVLLVNGEWKVNVCVSRLKLLGFHAEFTDDFIFLPVFMKVVSIYCNDRRCLIGQLKLETEVRLKDFQKR